MRPSSVPSNVVEDILFEACATFPSSPPFPPTAFALTCRALRARVEPCLNSLLARLFTLHFDRPRPIGHDAKLETPRIADEMRRRMSALYCIKAGRIFAADFDSDLRLSVLGTVYLMMLEDTGSNADHLAQTNLVRDAVNFVCRSVDEGLEGDRGWPAQTPLNAIVLAVLAGLLRRGGGHPPLLTKYSFAL